MTFAIWDPCCDISLQNMSCDTTVLLTVDYVHFRPNLFANESDLPVEFAQCYPSQSPVTLRCDRIFTTISFAWTLTRSSERMLEEHLGGNYNNQRRRRGGRECQRIWHRLNWSTSLGVNFDDLGRVGHVNAARAVQVVVLPCLSIFRVFRLLGILARFFCLNLALPTISK